jgi:hypothetical protein
MSTCLVRMRVFSLVDVSLSNRCSFGFNPRVVRHECSFL